MSMPRRLRASVWMTFAVVAAAAAQPAETFYRVNPPDFVPYASVDNYQNVGASLSGSDAGDVFVASVHAPPGARLTSFELDACDTAADAMQIQASLYQCDRFGQNCVIVSQRTVGDNAGCAAATEDLTLQPTTYINDSAHQLYVYLQTASTFMSLHGAVIGYKLQISPAPATATFGDVPTNYIYFRAIEALAASGIATGCGSGNYCPDQPVTRGEIAKFLANGLGLHWQ
jgi:hypothetical protein